MADRPPRPTTGIAPKPVFSGEWTLNREASMLSPGIAPTVQSGALRIEHREPAFASQPDPVDERAVRRTDVLHIDAVAPRLEARMVRRGELVALDREVVVAPAPNAKRMGVERDDVALVERRALEHDEPAELAGNGLREQGRCLLRREDHRLLRQAQVAGGGADDPPDEQVEQDEERDLEEKERCLDVRRSDDRGCLERAG